MTERTTFSRLLPAAILIWTLFPAPAATGAQTPVRPRTAGSAPMDGTVETICGQKVADPYRPLENLRDPRVQQWFHQESDRARAALDAIPGRAGLVAKMVEFDSRRSAKAYNLSITDNDRYFYLKQTPADETGKLFFRNGFKGRERELFDPSAFSDGTETGYVISSVTPNIDGSKVAVAVSANGSENSILLVMEVGSGRIYPERIDRCWFASPSWLPDGESFLYNRLNPGSLHDREREKNSRIFLHRAGSDPAADIEVFSRTANPELGIRPEEIPALHYDHKSGYLFAFTESVDPRMNAWYAPYQTVTGPAIPWKRLFRPEDEVYDFTATKSEIYLYSPRNAPRYRLLKTSLAAPDLERAETVIHERRDATLSGFSVTGKGVFYTLSFNGVREELYRKDVSGRSEEKISLPFDAGTISLGSKGFDRPDLWTVIGGWAHDFRRYRYDSETRSFTDETLSSPAEYPEYGDLTVDEVTVPSHDGVMVPLSLIHAKGLQRDGRNPVLIYGYGAYGNSVTPFFAPSLLLWTANGGVLAVAHVRGGGELGDAWHKAGMKGSKPNTWKDLIACAEYLVREGYTSPKHIAINAASAGGILVGRAMTERPDLFAAAMPQVGLLNALRGEETPNGPANIPEFGSSKDPGECRALIEMDAYLHLKKGVRYPAALVTAGMNDPRVIAWEPAKFAARLQASTASDRPVLFFTDFKAGHGIGDQKTKQFESLADILSFGLWQTGHPGFQPIKKKRD
ncbi:MAG: prolyl oligopeptidase family serine peptidase [Chlorobiaceae bacterium]|nr:prolyl oligopeptidase family serine peptidase [Chlorobiaceae bacterium]